ncbi:MAG: hypothetical protein LUO95_10570 [Methylococcaceae bacterium]|nr:hypothetical protein [Methylococcaceae bacterium]
MKPIIYAGCDGFRKLYPSYGLFGVGICLTTDLDCITHIQTTDKLESRTLTVTQALSVYFLSDSIQRDVTC